MDVAPSLPDESLSSPDLPSICEVKSDLPSISLVKSEPRTNKKRKLHPASTGDAVPDDARLIQETVNADEHYHFAMQLVPLLRGLPVHSATRVKAKMMCLLADAVGEQHQNTSFHASSQGVKSETSSLSDGH